MSSGEFNYNGFTFSKKALRNNSNNSNNSNTNYSNTNTTNTFNNDDEVLYNSTVRNKKKKSVTWKNNNNKIYHLNNNNSNHRKSIKVTKNNSNLTNDERKILRDLLHKTSHLTYKEMKKLRTLIVHHLKMKSERYGLHHLEPYEKNYLNFEATR